MRKHTITNETTVIKRIIILNNSVGQTLTAWPVGKAVIKRRKKEEVKIVYMLGKRITRFDLPRFPIINSCSPSLISFCLTSTIIAWFLL